LTSSANLKRSNHLVVWMYSWFWHA